jgi:histidine triad (HIT) family protein
MSDGQTIFTRIVRGEIPSHKVDEDEHTYAFLDINPLAPGHTLVIPKKAYVTLDECPEEVASALGRAVARVGRAVAAATGCAGWNVLQNNGRIAGQVVMHVHFHIIPRSEGDGLGYRWEPGELKPETAEKLKEAIRLALGSSR